MTTRRPRPLPRSVTQRPAEKKVAERLIEKMVELIAGRMAAVREMKQKR
jgi:hypothetical protein